MIAYRPEIDGLRAVAIIPVVLFHLGCPWLKGGYLGVDVFFVVSGFLITSVILRELDRGTFTLRAFWLRRIRRIFPALAAMLAVTSLAGTLVFSGNDPWMLGRTGIAALLSFANVALWRYTGDYWGADAETFPLLHTWSLSVEEQFYFAYPFLVLFLFRFDRKRLILAMSGLAAVSFAAYLYGATRHPASTFYLLPTRAWELAIGCLLAAVGDRGFAMPKCAPLLSSAGLAAIALSYHFLSKERAFPGALAIVVAGSALVIASATGPNGPVYRLLTARPAVFIGQISYSLYLWHWPILALIRNHNAVADTQVPDWVAPPLILLAALASYYGVEKTTRHRDRILKPALLLFALSGASSGFVIAQVRAFDFSLYSPVLWKGHQYDVAPTQMDPKAPGIERWVGIEVATREALAGDAYKTTGILRTYGRGGTDIVILGDSHAMMWAGVVDEIARDLGLNLSFFIAAGTSPFTLRGGLWTPEERAAFDHARISKILGDRPGLVLLLPRWSNVQARQETDRLFDVLRASGARVLTIEQPPELCFGDKNALKELLRLGVSPKPGEIRSVRPARGNQARRCDRGREVLAELEARYPFFSCVRIADLFQGADARVKVLEGTRLLYVDDDHLSQDGALKAKERIQTAIQRELTKAGRILDTPAPP